MCAQSDREEKEMSTYKNYLYSFEDVQKQAKDYGFEDSYMSEADWDLARKDPNRGMALVNAKNDWLTAETPEQKAWSHALAEDLRQQGGSYSGGADGSKFVPTGTQQHDSAWEDTLNATVRNLQNRKFEWSPETDPNVKYYEDAYRREGERAMKDVLGAVAATTGGIPSSYATAAAAQQRNYYAQQMADKYPELYKQAFDQFMKEYDNDYRMLEMYSQLSRDETDKWYKEQDIGLRGRDLDITENQYGAQNEIAWAELGLQDKDMQQKYNLAYAQLNQDDRHFVDDLLYRYNVMTEEGKQFWAKLAQDGEIADKEIKLEYDKLDQNTKNFLMEYALDVEKLEFEKDVHADEVRLTEAEIQLQYDKLDEEKRQHIKNLAFDYYSLAQQADQWNAEQKLAAEQLGLEKAKLNRNASLDQIEQAYAAAEFGDFSHLKKLGVNTDSYEALWNAQVEDMLNPDGKDVELPTEDNLANDDVSNMNDISVNDSSLGKNSKNPDGTWNMNVLIQKWKDKRPLTPEEQAVVDEYRKTIGHIK